MILTWGGYTHDNGEIELISLAKLPYYNEGGEQRGIKETWTLRGEKQAATHAALSTAITALDSAYSSGNKNLILYDDDGTTQSSHALLTADCLGGTRVISGPVYQQGPGEYTTFRNYQIVIEGDILDESILLVSFHETLSFSGGGERFIYLQPLNGLPIRQLVAEATPFRCVQRGSAVGNTGYPPPAIPTWPAAEHRDQRRIDYKEPKRSRAKGGRPTYTEFEISWEYYFEAAAPFVGAPNRWI